MPRVAENKEHEAKMIWEIENNLGVTEIEEQGRIVEKLMQMEDRDKKEAEKVGNISHNSTILSHTM